MLSFTPHPPKQGGYFLSQPHQPYFFLGIVWAVISMGVFVAAYRGIVPLRIAPAEFHLYSLAFIVFSHFFHGFLFTTFPRFCTGMPIPREVYVRNVWLYQGGAALFVAGSLLSGWLAWIGMGVLLFAHATAVYILLWSYRVGQSPIKTDPYWILISHAIALGIHGVWFLGLGAGLAGFDFDRLGWFSPAIVNLYLIFLTFVVAQRMIPFFSHATGPKSPRLIETVLALLVLKTLCAVFSLTLVEGAVGIVLGGYLLWEFLRWKLPLFRSIAILSILHLALFWLPAALLIGSGVQIAEALLDASSLHATTHLAMLGFLTTVLIGFGTRVVLGHSGQPPHADRIAVSIFVLTQIVILARFALSLDTLGGGTHAWLLDLSATGWIVLFGVWAARYGATLVTGKRMGA